MAESTDYRGRIYLPKDIRERFGDKYRIVELPSHVALFPVDDDPIEGIRAAVGDAFEGQDTDQLKTDARKQISREVQKAAENSSQEREDCLYRKSRSSASGLDPEAVHTSKLVF